MTSLQKMMQMCRILVRGVFSSEAIRTDFCEHRMSFSEEERHAIEAQWIAARSSKPSIFDGPLAHLRGFYVSHSKLCLELQKSSYKEYVGTRNLEFRTRFSSTRVVNPLCVGTVLLTCDRKLAYSSRQNVEVMEGLLGFPMGYVNPDEDLRNDQLDVFLALKRELAEEVGIVGSDIREIECIGLVGENPAYLAFETELTLSSSEIVERPSCETEWGKIEFLNADGQSIKRFIELNHARTVPHCIVNLLLLGASLWGETWLQETVANADPYHCS